MAKSSFKEFLVERGESESRKGLSELKFLEMLREKAKNSYEVIKQAPLYMEEVGEPFMHIMPHARPSKSPFWLDQLTTEHGNWKRFPNRTSCIKAHTDHNRYGHGENVYVVIPMDGSRLGICGADSFYRSFKPAEKSLNIDKLDNHWLSTWISNLRHGINDLGKLTDDKLSLDDADTYAQFKKQLRDVDVVFKKHRDVIAKNLKTEEVDDEVKLVFNDLLARHVTSLERYLEEKLDPETNGFHAVRVESYHKQPNDREVWISDPCLLVLRSKYVELYKRGAVK